MLQYLKTENPTYFNEKRLNKQAGLVAKLVKDKLNSQNKIDDWIVKDTIIQS